ncbi:hypothetical protein ACFV6F_33580 [Kitasatospora phosalacinea]
MKKTAPAKAPALTLDPKKVAALQAKIARLTGTGALAAAPHSYHH